MSTNPILLNVENLYKHYSHPTSNQKGPEILKGLTLALKQGEAMSVIGPSGSGKSTLLNIIAGLDSPTSGCVTFNKDNISQLNERESARYRNQEIGLIFQDHHLLPQCTVLENVLMPTLAPGNKHSKHDAKDYAVDILGKVGLDQRLTYYPANLSGGERQRVAVVRSLVNRPKLILADEPTGGLDQKSAIELITLLLDLNRSECISLIMVTHSVELAKKMQRVEELRDGRLKVIGAG